MRRLMTLLVMVVLSGCEDAASVRLTAIYRDMDPDAENATMLECIRAAGIQVSREGVVRECRNAASSIEFARAVRRVDSRAEVVR